MKKNKGRMNKTMLLEKAEQLTYVRTDALEEFDDVVVRGMFPAAWKRHHQLIDPMFYVTFYHEGGHQVEIFDEGQERNGECALLAEEAETCLIQFAKAHLTKGQG